MQIRHRICQQAMLKFSTLSCAIPHMECILQISTMFIQWFSVDTLSEAKDVRWDECGKHLEAKQQCQDSKNRSKRKL